jgi:hypothetical protein
MLNRLVGRLDRLFKGWVRDVVEAFCCSSLSCRITYLLIKGRQRKINEAFSGAESKFESD